MNNDINLFQILRKLLLPLLLMCVALTFLYNFEQNWKINKFSLNFVKQINSKGFLERYSTIDQKEFEGKEKCHYLWFRALRTYYIQDIDRSLFTRSFKCMKDTVSMAYSLLPFDNSLAIFSNNLYPDMIITNYWVLDNLEVSDRTSALLFARDISHRFPKDAVIWRRLGGLLWRNAQYEEGLQAYLNACKINDYASNGCYYVGTSYRSLGDPIQAIKYFRVSYWPPSWKEADLIEAQLASDGIVP